MSDLECVFSRIENDLDFSDALKTGKILIVNLAKGALGDEPSRLLGGLIVTGIQQAALARASMPAAERSDFWLYVDEFHNFTVASFESILSESAKYRLNLTLANQTLGQLSPSLQRAIFGNCATVLSFQVSADDAPQLRKEMHRSRVIVRPKGESDYSTLSDFLAYQRQLYRGALEDDYLGMSASERQAYRNSQKFSEGDGFLAAFDKGAAAGEMTRQRRVEIQETLQLLERDYIDVKTLRELFSDFEFRDESFPEVDDFLNVPPHYAFCRVGSADNVSTIHIHPPVEPDSTRRAEVEKHLEQFARSEPEKEVTAKKATPKEPETFLE